MSRALSRRTLGGKSPSSCSISWRTGGDCSSLSKCWFALILNSHAVVGCFLQRPAFALVAALPPECAKSMSLRLRSEAPLGMPKKAINAGQTNLLGNSRLHGKRVKHRFVQVRADEFARLDWSAPSCRAKLRSIIDLREAIQLICVQKIGRGPSGAAVRCIGAGARRPRSGPPTRPLPVPPGGATYKIEGGPAQSRLTCPPQARAAA